MQNTTVHRAARATQQSNIFISKAEALEIVAACAPNVLVLEVVSEFYKQQPAAISPVSGFARIQIDRFEAGPVWNLRPDPQLQAILAEYALTPEASQRILLFDTIHLNCGQVQSRFDASARLFSVLHFFGFSNVSIIMDADIQAGFPHDIAASYPPFVPRCAAAPEASGRELWTPKHPDYFVDYETLVRMLAGSMGPYRLLDARSAEEFAGQVTGYEHIPLAGRIPTAENVPNGDFQVSVGEGVGPVLARLAAALSAKGIGPGDRVVWYCGTGWRASRMCALTQALGYTNVSIYDGGWSEWHRRHPEHGAEKPRGAVRQLPGKQCGA